jgi:hypothetical protein
MHRPSPAAAISLVALFLALTGGAYAAGVRLPASSVGTKQIKKNAVTLTKIAPAARKALKGATGVVGPAGPKGADGAAGAQGPQGDRGPAGPVASADASGNIDVATSPQAGDTNTIRIGTTQQHATFIPAIANDNSGTGASAVYVESNGRLDKSVPSSRAFKRDIHPLRFSTKRFMSLQPVRFQYKRGGGGTYYGLIAEDVAKRFPRIVAFEGRRAVGIHMEQMPVILLTQVQRQQRQIAALERRIARLERRHR